MQCCETLANVWASFPGHTDCTVSAGNGLYVCACVCVSGSLIAAKSVKRLIALIDNNSEDSIFINCGQEKERWIVS